MIRRSRSSVRSPGRARAAAAAPLPLLGRLLLGVAPVVASGCALFGHPQLPPEEIPRHLAEAELEVDAKDLELALDRLTLLWNQEQLLPGERARTEELLQTTVEELVALHRTEGSSSYLVSVFERDIPTRLRALAGVSAARLRLDEGDRVGAYRLVLVVEEEIPGHPFRLQAGDVLAEAGLDLIVDGGHYDLFFSYQARGIAALEYLVLNHPSHERCPEAYEALIARYEDDHELDLAIERCEDLLLFHPGRPQAVPAQARLPYLRMRRLESDTYDRSELVMAQRELDRWLALYAGHALEEWVRESQRECLARLASSDLVLASFYHRKRSSFGTRIHAERALSEARAAGDEDAMADARRLLDDIPQTGFEDEAPVVPTVEPPEPVEDIP